MRGTRARPHEPVQDGSVAGRFGASSRWVDLDGPLHVAEVEGRDGPPTFVLVHGLGGSYLDWSEIAPLLARHGRVLALDLPGFGLTPPDGRSGTVRDDVRLLCRFVDAHTSGPVVLVGNSRGGMVSALAAPRLPRVSGVVLVGAALPVRGLRPDPRALVELFPAALPVVGPWVIRYGRRRLSSEQQVQRMLRYCFPDPDRAPAAYVEALRDLQARRRLDDSHDGTAARAARTVVTTFLRHRRYDAALDRVEVPVLLVHGTADRLVPVAAARRALARRPAWTGHVLDGVGHTAQLKVPDAVEDAIRSWLPDAPTVPGADPEGG